jgi:membrane protein
MGNPKGEQPSQDRPVGQLIRDASEQMSRLVRQEMRLATAELRQKAARVGVGGGLLSAGGVLGFYAGAALVGCAILALALVLAPWLAALIVGAVIGLVAGVLVLIGKKQVQKAAPPVPEEAVASVKEDIDALKEGLQR